MIKSIQRLRGFGVFDDYTKQAEMKDFSDRNLIYGWNYSGKTTLSRLFATLETKKLHDDFPLCKFTISEAGGSTVSDETLAECTAVVRVFNSDFVEQNLRWDGTGFNPILLLGDESKEAQDKLEWYERVVKRCGLGAAAKRQLIAKDQQLLSQAKTDAARQVRMTLGLTESLNATHLDKLLQALEIVGSNYALNQEQLSSDLKLASSSTADQLPELDSLQVSLAGRELRERAGNLLAHVPASAQTLEHLAKNPAISEWVGQGLQIHTGKSQCEFCTNAIAETRRDALNAHFSQEMIAQKADLQDLDENLKAARIVFKELRESDFYAQFRGQLPEARSRLLRAIADYNRWLDDLAGQVKTKLGAQYTAFSPPENPSVHIVAVDEAASQLNTLIERHNEVAANFDRAKADAVYRLKMHYAQHFFLAQRLEGRKAVNELHEMQAKRYDKAGEAAKVHIAALQAKIDKAQNGRARINERIATLLGSDAIQITVDGEPGNQRFRLTRRGKIAKRLSEGERTAIAFAYFLTTLEAHGKLEDVVVFIDDPISSLDSNHIFQVYSILRATFFKWANVPSGKPEWVTTCRQLFISTHNFEFFSLVRDFRGSNSNPLRLYMTKRINGTQSTILDLPASIAKHTSEYHYLFSVLHSFNESTDKESYDHLLAIPNAARRFLEMYTYSRLPSGDKNIERRASLLFGKEETMRIVKLLHHFSHLESIERLATNTDLISDIAAVVADILRFLKTKDDMHYQALVEAMS